MDQQPCAERAASDEYITRVVGAYSRMLLHIAYNLLRSEPDAEDAVQETFVRLVTRRPAFRDSEHEKAWLIRVTINIARNMLKASSRIRCTDGLPETAAPADGAPAAEQSLDLLRAVLALPERYGTVVHLYYYEDMSIREIARALRLPAATVGTRLARARELLRRGLEGDDGK